MSLADELGREPIPEEVLSDPLALGITRRDVLFILERLMCDPSIPEERLETFMSLVVQLRLRWKKPNPEPVDG